MADSGKTTKSFKSAERDKPKHSIKGGSKVVKRDGNGKGSWGKPLDELKANLNSNGALDRGDPNYVPKNEVLQDREPWSPKAPAPVRFASSIADLTNFKSQVREAALGFLETGSEEELDRAIAELDLPLYHQDIPYVLLKLGLGQGPEQLTRLLKQLHRLNGLDIVTEHQMAQGFRKLGNSLPDTLIDVPNALALFEEALAHATISGYLEPKVGADIRSRCGHLRDNKDLLRFTKGLIADFVREYLLGSADPAELARATAELRAAWLNFEVAKELLSQGLDRDARARDLVSLGIAHLVGSGTVPAEDVEHAFAVLLERAEDLCLDVPRALELLGCFLARAVVDEAVTPAFLVRVDLVHRDMGAQVLELAQALLKRPGARPLLAEVWSSAAAAAELGAVWGELQESADRAGAQRKQLGERAEALRVSEQELERTAAAARAGLVPAPKTPPAAAAHPDHHDPLAPALVSPVCVNGDAAAGAAAGGCVRRSFAAIARDAEARSRHASEAQAPGSGASSPARSRHASELLPNGQVQQQQQQQRQQQPVVVQV